MYEFSHSLENAMGVLAKCFILFIGRHNFLRVMPCLVYFPLIFKVSRVHFFLFHGVARDGLIAFCSFQYALIFAAFDD